MLNNTDTKQEKFIIIDNKESRLAVRHLYEELSSYVKHIVNNSQAEVHLPNKDIALKINQILVRNTNKLSVRCPNCKTVLAYNDLQNDAIDPKLEEYYKRKLKELQIAETCLFEIFDYLANRNLFQDLKNILQTCTNSKTDDSNNSNSNSNSGSTKDIFISALPYLYLLEKENFNNQEEAEKISKKTEEFIKEIGQKADENNKYIQTLLGRIAKEGGCGIKKNINTSVKMLTKAVENKHYPAFNSLGFLYLNGVNKVFQDTQQAVKLFTEGSENKDTNCMTNLGWCYDNGIGTDQNYFKAVELYKEAAYLGNIKAMSNLGYSYRHGQGCEKSPKKCIEWLYKASELGDASAQMNLGFCYQIGFGVKEDKQAAFKLFMNAAKSDFPAACNNVAFCYEQGYGIKQDYEAAFYWYKRGAELGHAKSMTSLGVYYINGKVVSQNTEEALKWFNKAIDKGDMDAKYAVEFIREEQQNSRSNTDKSY